MNINTNNLNPVPDGLMAALNSLERIVDQRYAHHPEQRMVLDWIARAKRGELLALEQLEQWTLRKREEHEAASRKHQQEEAARRRSSAFVAVPG